ncbi:hypothetical protein [Robertmurraya sp. FSL R5-0851]
MSENNLPVGMQIIEKRYADADVYPNSHVKTLGSYL